MKTKNLNLVPKLFYPKFSHLTINLQQFQTFIKKFTHKMKQPVETTTDTRWKICN